MAKTRHQECRKATDWVQCECEESSMAETKEAVNSKLATWSQQQQINRKCLKRDNKIALQTT